MRIADAETYDFRDIAFRTETAKAILCEIGGKPFWVPKSQIENYRLGAGRRFAVLTVRLWWAEKAGALTAYELSRDDDDLDAALPEAPRPESQPPVVYEFMSDLNQFWQAVKEDSESGLSPNFPRANAIYRKLALKYHPDLNRA